MGLVQGQVAEDLFIETYLQVAKEATLLEVETRVLAAYQPDTYAEVTFAVTFRTALVGDFGVQNQMPLAYEEGRWGVENQYSRSVNREGNQPAQELLGKVFEPCDRAWRGIGELPGSGLGLRREFEAFDAEKRFSVELVSAEESPECIAGEILQGLKKPHECEAFGVRCTPEHPLGAPMVSSEGACAAYYQYGRSDS